MWQLFLQLLLAFRHIHEDHRVVHRDLTPSNIMLEFVKSSKYASSLQIAQSANAKSNALAPLLIPVSASTSSSLSAAAATSAGFRLLPSMRMAQGVKVSGIGTGTGAGAGVVTAVAAGTGQTQTGDAAAHLSAVMALSTTPTSLASTPKSIFQVDAEEEARPLWPVSSSSSGAASSSSSSSSFGANGTGSIGLSKSARHSSASTTTGGSSSTSSSSSSGRAFSQTSRASAASSSKGSTEKSHARVASAGDVDGHSHSGFSALATGESSSSSSSGEDIGDVAWTMGTVADEVCEINLKVMDFGLARQTSSEQSLIQSAVGTISYACPEIVLRQPYTSKADIWSLGCILYQMAELSPPFLGNNPLLLAQCIVEGRHPPVDPNGFYSPLLQRVVSACLQPDPAHRPSVKELIALVAPALLNEYASTQASRVTAIALLEHHAAEMAREREAAVKKQLESEQTIADLRAQVAVLTLKLSTNQSNSTTTATASASAAASAVGPTAVNAGTESTSSYAPTGSEPRASSNARLVLRANSQQTHGHESAFSFAPAAIVTSLSSSSSSSHASSSSSAGEMPEAISALSIYPSSPSVPVLPDSATSTPAYSGSALSGHLRHKSHGHHSTSTSSSSSSSPSPSQSGVFPAFTSSSSSLSGAVAFGLGTSLQAMQQQQHQQQQQQQHQSGAGAPSAAGGSMRHNQTRTYTGSRSPGPLRVSSGDRRAVVPSMVPTPATAITATTASVTMVKTLVSTASSALSPSVVASGAMRTRAPSAGIAFGEGELSTLTGSAADTTAAKLMTATAPLSSFLANDDIVAAGSSSAALRHSSNHTSRGARSSGRQHNQHHHHQQQQQQQQQQQHQHASYATRFFTTSSPSLTSSISSASASSPSSLSSPTTMTHSTIASPSDASGAGSAASVSAKTRVGSGSSTSTATTATASTYSSLNGAGTTGPGSPSLAAVVSRDDVLQALPAQADGDVDEGNVLGSGHKSNQHPSYVSNTAGISSNALLPSSIPARVFSSSGSRTSHAASSSASSSSSSSSSAIGSGASYHHHQHHHHQQHHRSAHSLGGAGALIASVGGGAGAEARPTSLAGVRASADSGMNGGGDSLSPSTSARSGASKQGRKLSATAQLFPSPTPTAGT